MARVTRHDRGELSKPTRDSNGWLRADGYIARPGILEYKRADGTAWREYRPPEEAFKADALESFEAVPFTDDHPRAGRLDAGNTREFQVGTVSQVRQDGDRVRARILVTDARVIAKMEAGKLELSCGYDCEVLDTPGTTPDGQRYDAIQTNVRGNHVALVDAARAGPEFRVRLDSLEVEVYSPFTSEKPPQEPKKMALLKIKLDGVEVEVEETVAKAFASQSERAQAKIDALEASNKELTSKLAAAPGEVKAALVARMALEGKASKHLPEAKFDGMSDLDIKRAVAEKLSGRKLDGKGEAYVDAAFEISLETAEQTKPEPKQTKFDETHVDGSDPVAAAQAKFNAALKSNFTPSQEN